MLAVASIEENSTCRVACRSAALLALLALLGLRVGAASTSRPPSIRSRASRPRPAYLWDDDGEPAAGRPALQPDGHRLADPRGRGRGIRGAWLSRRGIGRRELRLSYDLTVHTWYGPNNSSSLGSLSLWLAEAATQRRVWMGYVRAEILVGLSREERLARMRDAMARLLDTFPPSQRGESS